MLRQIATAALFAVLFAVLCPAVLAQEVREVDPAWRVVTRDGVPARCGPESVFYAVAEFDTGRLVRVDGLTDTQARVRYPEDLSAMVPADEVRVLNDTTVELVRASGLRAPSELMGLAGSWKALYEPAIPAGTTLTVRETLKNKRGEVVGYAVAAPMPPVAPTPARAFVPLDALRDATPEEVAAHEGSRADETRPDRAASTRETEADRPATPPATPPATDDDQDAGTPDAAPGAETAPNTADDSMLEPMTPPVSDDPADNGVRSDPAADPTRIEASDLEDLEASFEAARALPPEQLDQALDELLAEYRRSREAFADDERLAAQLDMRIEWLELRIATRDQRRAITAAVARADDRSKALEAEVAQWQDGRAYQLVGRLVQSTVYNGERLPRMFRVQALTSLDGVPRTLGYLVPDAATEAKLGAVVGIVGEARFDPQLRLMVIKADRVDVMPE